MSWLFVLGNQSIGASASVLPMNIQGVFPLGLIVFVSLKFMNWGNIMEKWTEWP